MDKKAKPEHKSIFDDKFKYVKISVEVLKLQGLNSNDRIILSRIIFWTRKGMPCTQTNKQFAELIGRSESAAKYSVRKLIRKNYIYAIYWNDRSKGRKDCNRELTSMVGVGSKFCARMMAQAKKKAEVEKRAKAEQDQQRGCENDPTPRLKITRPHDQKQPATTIETTKETTKAAHLPPPANGQASAPRKKTVFEFELERRKKGGFKPISDKEFQERKQQQIVALRTTNVHYG
jgi:hypothetical protein